MRAIELYQLINSMHQGQSLCVSEDSMREAVLDDMPSRFDSVTVADVYAFAEKIGRNWNAEIARDYYHGGWIIERQMGIPQLG